MGLENGAEKMQKIPSEEIGRTLAKVDIPDNAFGKSAEIMTEPTLAQLRVESDSLKSTDLIIFASKLGGFGRQKNINSIVDESEKKDLALIVENLNKFNGDSAISTVKNMISTRPDSPYKTYFVNNITGVKTSNEPKGNSTIIGDKNQRESFSVKSWDDLIKSVNALGQNSPDDLKRSVFDSIVVFCKGLNDNVPGGTKKNNEKLFEVIKGLNSDYLGRQCTDYISRNYGYNFSDNIKTASTQPRWIVKIAQNSGGEDNRVHSTKKSL